MKWLTMDETHMHAFWQCGFLFHISRSFRPIWSPSLVLRHPRWRGRKNPLTFLCRAWTHTGDDSLKKSDNSQPSTLALSLPFPVRLPARSANSRNPYTVYYIYEHTYHRARNVKQRTTKLPLKCLPLYHIYTTSTWAPTFFFDTFLFHLHSASPSCHFLGAVEWSGEWAGPSRNKGPSAWTELSGARIRKARRPCEHFRLSVRYKQHGAFGSPNVISQG